MRLFLSSLVFLFLLPLAHAADVVVYGGNAGGVIAAVAAAREGKSVILIEPGTHLGGMVSGGLGATDTGKRGAIGGYSLEFFQRVKAHYVTKYGANSAQVKDCDDGFKFEPHVAEKVFQAMIAEAKVEVKFQESLKGIKRFKNQILSIDTTKGATYQAVIFIDASYEGDLMAQAGVKYHIGRESRETYGESIAGVQARSPAHQWPVPVPARGADGKPLPFVQGFPYPATGSADKAVQAYNYRLCMTNVPENRFAWPKPANYDANQFELLARYLKAKPNLTMRNLMNPVKMPNGKTDTNNNGAFSTDHIGANWDYPEGDAVTRERIRLDHIAYTQGFLYFLANDPRVPKTLHDEMNNWGLAKDEFQDTQHWPHQFYVREARRMIGPFVLTQKDITTELRKDDSVGLGSYNTDSHHVQRLIDKDGNAINEGDFQIGVKPYAIPYRTVTPLETECSNLLVPVCMSASHVGYCTVRMEPVYMVLGHACGVAAAMAAEGKSVVQKVEYAKLKAKLLAQKAVLDPAVVPTPAGGGAEAIDITKLKGVVVDDPDAKLTGEWKRSQSTGKFVGVGYIHDDNDSKGMKTARYTPKLPGAGQYEVYFYYPAHTNRATKVPVVINTSDGEKTVTVNEQQAAGVNGKLLGTFQLKPENAWVEVRTTDTKGHVVADAVRFVEVK